MIDDRAHWNSAVTSLPNAHLLQSWEWGELKSKYGWNAHRLLWTNESGSPLAAAQILQRNLSLPGIGNRFSILYCPRGPVLDWSVSTLRSQVLADLQDFISDKSAIFLKIDPGLPLSTTEADEYQTLVENPTGKDVVETLKENGWRTSGEYIQFRNTFLLDLSKSEDTLLAEMKQKTRYNIRLAARQGVSVRLGEMHDFDLLYRMYAETSIRDGFAIRAPWASCSLTQATVQKPEARVSRQP